MSESSTGHWQSGPLPWHRASMARLAEQHRQHRLPHALLITGSEGIGKAWFAGALTAGLLCQQTQDLQPCGRCDNCEQFKAGSHGDQRWVAVDVEKDKKAIGIDQIRDAIGFVQKTAAYGNQKVLVVCPAEKMTVAAANALLKTLEEPSDDTLIALVCHQPWLLPVTVRSRCQQLVLPAPGVEQQRQWLVDAGVPESEVDALIALAAGKPLKALALVDPESRAQQAALLAVWDGLLSGSGTPLQAVDALKGIAAPEALESLQTRLEQGIRGMLPAQLRGEGARQLALHRYVSALLRRMRSGANPGREILLDNVCAAVVSAGSGTADDAALHALGEVLGIGSGRG